MNSIRTRIFVGICIVVGVGLYFFCDWILDDLTPRYRQTTEEPLVDTARVLAAVVAQGSDGMTLRTEAFRAAIAQAKSEHFTADIFGFIKSNVDFRVYITDTQGLVVFDSLEGRDEGKDFSKWRDVRSTLHGLYGARTSRDLELSSTLSVMYVAAPITKGDKLLGVLSVGKPTSNANQIVEVARKRIIVAASVTGLVTILVGLILTSMLTDPLRRLTRYAREVRDGKRTTLPKFRTQEVHQLGEAFEEMRQSLEGKQYVERYVQSLTHELKSPLSSIRGAAELLKEELPAEQRTRFIENIEQESTRMQGIVENLLLLSSLEKRSLLAAKERFDLVPLISNLVERFQTQHEARHISYYFEHPGAVMIEGDRFLLNQAILNLLQNASEFSPEHGRIEIRLQSKEGQVSVSIVDEGPGVPGYAIDRVFDRFYSLERPSTRRKSSGLGLSLVREIAQLHRGEAVLHNRMDGDGATSILTLPVLYRSGAESMKNLVKET